jgi:hypothetical protein
MRASIKRHEQPANSLPESGTRRVARASAAPDADDWIDQTLLDAEADPRALALSLADALADILAAEHARRAALAR